MNKTARMYAVITQGFLQIFILIYLGYKLGGDWWLKDPKFSALFAGIGAVVGIIIMIITLVKVGDVFDKRKDV